MISGICRNRLTMNIPFELLVECKINVRLLRDSESYLIKNQLSFRPEHIYHTEHSLGLCNAHHKAQMRIL